MLVSVTLVLLIMLMFGEIFGLATGTLQTQRGITQNDQRSRTLTIVIKGDLAKRTFRNVIPFAANEQPGSFGNDPNMLGGDLDNRQGYFHYSENVPDDDTDDVLQFTVRSTITQQNDDTSPYYGRAFTPWEPGTAYQVGNFICPTTGNGWVYVCTGAGVSATAEPSWPTTLGTGVTDGSATWDAYLNMPLQQNQPDSDDGIPGNCSATSTEAEICYFLRNGTLYRRVQLIRQPLDIEPQPTFTFPPASTPPTADIFNDTAALYTYNGSFLRDFDFSAFHVPGALTANQGVRFHGPQSLFNHYQEPGSTTTPLGVPAYRFGFHHFVVGSTASGQPREFVGTGATRRFIGRFVHEETSFRGATPADNFGYPFDDTTSPMSNAALTLNDKGIVTQYFGDPSSRRAEDIMMTNVHSFDVKIWDDFLGGFYDVGHAEDEDTIGNGNGTLDTGEDLNGNGSIDPGIYNYSSPYHFNLAFGPNPLPAGAPDPVNRVYDTWHSQMDLDGDGTLEAPPFRPVSFGADGLPGTAGVDDDLNGTVDDFSEALFPNTDDSFLPLRAIRITIRFLDEGSDQMRQMTIVHSLTD